MYGNDSKVGMRERVRVFVYSGVCQVHPNLSVLRVRERVYTPQLHLRAIRTATWVIRSQRNKDGKKKRKVISPITRGGKTDRASRNSTGAKPGQGVEASATMRNSTDYHLAQRRSPVRTTTCTTGCLCRSRTRASAM